MVFRTTAENETNKHEKATIPHEMFSSNDMIKHEAPPHKDGDDSVCISGDTFYYSITTHGGNLNGQMKLIHDNMIQGNELLYLKNNTFYATDRDVSPEDAFSLHGMIPLVFKGNDKLSSYLNAQHRFLSALKTMTELQEKRMDQTVRWFVLADDDFFHIPMHFFRVLAKYELKVSRGEHEQTTDYWKNERLFTCEWWGLCDIQ